MFHRFASLLFLKSKKMKILFWIVSLGLVAFEMVAGTGKLRGGKMALDWMNKLDVAKPFMSAFGGLEVGAAGVIIYSLVNKSAFFDQLVPWACLVLVVLKVVELILQNKASEPFAAMVGPIVVLVLVAAFYFIRQSI
ncbi:hypothetical protein ES692_17510 [Psychroserpens burtonensis]|uniref:DoxX family protein n=2 Tax=Psychroserpens burtonensis TaxID=49278 RepID=A0A5C7B9L2_9FLAO|nr:hypothetical protein ES692_17510 [Psychroserpens burtonensis]